MGGSEGDHQAGIRFCETESAGWKDNFKASSPCGAAEVQSEKQVAGHSKFFGRNNAP